MKDMNLVQYKIKTEFMAAKSLERLVTFIIIRKRKVHEVSIKLITIYKKMMITKIWSSLLFFCELYAFETAYLLLLVTYI